MATGRASEQGRAGRSVSVKDGPHGVVLHRAGERILSQIAFGVMVFVSILIWFSAPHSITLIDRIEMVSCIIGIAWISWLIAKARIMLNSETITVVNWFVRWDIPWSAVASFRATSDVQISLADGRVIRPSIGGGSLIGQMRNNPVQNRIVSEIRSRRPRKAGDDTNSVRFRVDVEPVKFVISAAVLIALTVVFYYLRYR